MALVHDSVCNLLKLFGPVWWVKLNTVLAELRMSLAVLARSSPNNSGLTLWFFEHNGLKSGCKIGRMASFRLKDSSRHTWP